MNSITKIKAHWSFWLISTLMLIWNVMGSANFFLQLNPEFLANYRESEQALVAVRPIWATIAFGIAVFGGAIGCLLLLLRKSIALHVFVISLLGVGVTTFHTLTSGINFSTGEMAGVIFMPIAVAIFLIWYAMYANKKGWLAT